MTTLILSQTERDDDLSIRLAFNKWRHRSHYHKCLKRIAMMEPKRCAGTCAMIHDLPGRRTKCGPCKAQANLLQLARKRHPHLTDQASYDRHRAEKARKWCKECKVELTGKERAVCYPCLKVLRAEVEAARAQMPDGAICKGCGHPRPVPHHIHGTKILVAPLCTNCNLGLSRFNDSPAFMKLVAMRIRGEVPPAPPWGIPVTRLRL